MDCMSWTSQAPLPMGFSRQGYWSGLPFPSPEDLPYPGIKPGSPTLQEDSLPTEPPGKHQALVFLSTCPYLRQSRCPPHLQSMDPLNATAFSKCNDIPDAEPLQRGRNFSSRLPSESRVQYWLLLRFPGWQPALIISDLAIWQANPHRSVNHCPPLQYICMGIYTYTNILLVLFFWKTLTNTMCVLLFNLHNNPVN